MSFTKKPPNKPNKNLKTPTVTRTTTWKGMNALGDGIPGATESPSSRAKPVPDLHVFWLCRQSTATFIFVCRRTAKQLLFLSPPKSQQMARVRTGKVPPHGTSSPNCKPATIGRLKPKSPFDPMGHRDSPEPSTVDGARSSCCQPGAWPAHSASQQLTQHHKLSSARLSTHARHI